jgi:hypothetical protein
MVYWIYLSSVLISLNRPGDDAFFPGKNNGIEQVPKQTIVEGDPWGRKKRKIIRSVAKNMSKKASVAASVLLPKK